MKYLMLALVGLIGCAHSNKVEPVLNQTTHAHNVSADTCEQIYSRVLIIKVIELYRSQNAPDSFPSTEETQLISKELDAIYTARGTRAGFLNQCESTYNPYQAACMQQTYSLAAMEVCAVSLSNVGR